MKKKTIRLFFLLVIFIFTLTLLGCSGGLPGEAPDDGLLEIVISPTKIGNVKTILVKYTRIEIVFSEQSGGEEQLKTVTDVRGLFKFLGLDELVPRMAMSFGVLDGFISQVRFISDGGSIGFTDGTVTEFKFPEGTITDFTVPSGPQTGLKLVPQDGQIETRQGHKTTFTISFDPEQYIVDRPGKDPYLKPVLHGEVTSIVPIAPPELYVPQQVVVMAYEGVTQAQIEELNAQIGAEILYSIPTTNPDTYIIKIPDSMTVEEALEFYRSSPLIEGTHLNYYLELYRTPTDLNPNQINNHYMDIIQMEQAWDIETGDSGVKVAITDTGVDPFHPDLKKNLREGRNSLFLLGPPEVLADTTDTDGHGTNMAGIIGASANDDWDGGIVGINWDVSIFPVKVAEGSFDLIDTILLDGLEWAKEQNVDIINISAGRSLKNLSQDEINGLKLDLHRRTSPSILYVLAAGNVGGETPQPFNADEHPERLRFPQQFFGPNRTTIIVGAIDNSTPPHLYVSSLSATAYGQQYVDLMAPGLDVYTTILNESYYFVNGTSPAAAQVTGVAALVLAEYPYLRGDPQAIKDFILGGTDFFDTLIGTCSTNGRLNAFGALR